MAVCRVPDLFPAFQREQRASAGVCDYLRVPGNVFIRPDCEQNYIWAIEKAARMDYNKNKTMEGQQGKEAAWEEGAVRKESKG